MQVQIFSSSSAAYDVLILPVSSGKALTNAGQEIDAARKGVLTQILEKADKFKGDKGQTFYSDLNGDEQYKGVLFFGLGEVQKLKTLDFETCGAKVFTAVKGKGKKVAAALEGFAEDRSVAAMAEFANGARLKSYRFDQYKTKTKKDDGVDVFAVIGGKDASLASNAYKEFAAVTDGVFEARDLVSEPANILNPVSYAKRVKAMFKKLDVKVKVLDDKKMEKMGMGAIVAVGKASETPSRMVLMEYNGLGKSSKTPEAAFVGKGVTFDTGGVSIKPGAGMEDMKFDMAGSAAVVGLIKALAGRKAKVHVVGAIGLAENTLSERAYRPSDVLTTYSGQTVEVINTDAEGRLVLADTLSYVQDEYKPKTIIDLATLTGAMMVALGEQYSGTYTTTKKLYHDLERAAEATLEDVWRMPLHKAYDKQVNSPIADMRNLGTSRYGGACSAAAFLHRFIEDGTEWAHMDIAGVAWWKADTTFVPKGATGYGVRLLNQFVADRYES